MTDAERLARAVLLFHRGGPWTAEDAATWRSVAGSEDASTRALCDLARRLLDTPGSPRGKYCERPYPCDCDLHG
jgi:hypothetical protein